MSIISKHNNQILKCSEGICEILNAIFRFVQTISQSNIESDLKTSLEQELESPEANTIWDKVAPLLNRQQILKSVLVQ